jgi:DNA primase
VPVICFDGDAAGQRAALRTAELALAHLRAERSLRVLRLPAKDDPDSLIRRGGPPAFQAALERAEPLAAALYDMVAATAKRGTPEDNAAFLHRLDELAGLIPDKTLASEYRQTLRGRYYEQRRAGRAAWAPPFRPGQKGRDFARPVPLPPRPAPDAATADTLRAKLMLATLLAHPVLIHEVEEAFAHVPLPPEDEPLRQALHDFAACAAHLDAASLFTHLEGLGLAARARAVQAQAAAEYRLAPDASPAEAADAWWSWYSLMDFSIEMLRAQRDEAEAFWLAHPDDAAACARLVKYNQLLAAARAGEAGNSESGP